MIELTKKYEIRGTQSVNFELDEEWLKIFQADVDINYIETDKTPITFEMVKECWKGAESTNYGLDTIVHHEDGTESTLGEILYDIIDEYLNSEGCWDQPEIDWYEAFDTGVFEYTYDD